MPSDRKARSQTLGAYTFLAADKKYSFARATQLAAREPCGSLRGVRFDGATGIAALLKIVAPMSPSATGGRSPDGEDTVATKSRSLPRRVNSLSAAANPLDPAKPAFSVRRPAAHPRHRLLYCSADVPIGDWWQALDGGDTVATYLAAVPRGAVAAATGAAAEAF